MAARLESLEKAAAMNLTDPIFQDADKARAHLEATRWPNGPICPHCGVVDDATRLPAQRGRPTKAHPEGALRAGVLQCNACRGQFSVTVGTVFESSKVPLNKWLLATYLMSSSKMGYSAHQLHRTLGVTYKTAWFMCHRIREAMNPTSKTPIGGAGKTVEADETFIGRDGNFSARGGKNMNAVLSMVDRGTGRLRSVVLDNVTANNVTNVLGANVAQDTRLLTDASNVYRRMGSALAAHESVNHSVGEYVREADPTVHTNTVEGTFSIFKRGMRGVYQHCARKHLHRYLAEFDFRYSNRVAVGIDDSARADNALAGVRGKRLTYETVSRRWPAAEARIVW